MLQTAPVLLMFPPTTGPKAKPDGQPIRYDFTQGYASKNFSSSYLELMDYLVPNPLIRFESGFQGICQTDRSLKYTGR